MRTYAKKNVDVLLVGNKVDLEKQRVVEFKTAKDFADERDLPYMETSAKTGTNVDSAFIKLATSALQAKMAEKDKVEENGAKAGGEAVQLREGGSASSSSRCCS